MCARVAAGAHGGRGHPSRVLVALVGSAAPAIPETRTGSAGDRRPERERVVTERLPSTPYDAA